MKEYKLKINGNSYRVAINDYEGHVANMEVNGTPYKVELEESEAPVSKTPKIVQAQHVPTGENQPVKTAAPGSAGALKSPLPGVILSVDVSVGAQVKVGQKLMVLEAMKMENIIEADREGTVSAIKVSKGESVLEGADLLIIS
jgi:biotin carboxyl carrier protein